MTSPDSTAQNVIDGLDSFYCHNIVASLWTDAVANRLDGMGIYLLSDEFPDCSDPRAMASYAFDRLNVLITAYQAFLDTVRG